MLANHNIELFFLDFGQINGHLTIPYKHYFLSRIANYYGLKKYCR